LYSRDTERIYRLFMFEPRAFRYHYCQLLTDETSRLGSG
jgi:hypothetical protein